MRIIKAIVVGGLIGAAVTSIDGAILGFFVASDAKEILNWTLGFAVGGAILGAALGALLMRLSLRPPGEE